MSVHCLNERKPHPVRRMLFIRLQIPYIKENLICDETFSERTTTQLLKRGVHGQSSLVTMHVFINESFKFRAKSYRLTSPDAP